MPPTIGLCLCLLIAALAPEARGAAPPAIGGPMAVADSLADAASDSSEAARFLAELQGADDARFDPELLGTDTSFADSLVRSLETLGFETYREQVDAQRRRWGWDVDPRSALWTYNRVEGIVPAVRLELRPREPDGPRLGGEAGWATGPGALRWRSTARLPFGRSGLRLEAAYGDRVVPFGSNRPVGNAVRALVAGADEQDYLRRRGGRIGLVWADAEREIGLAYHGARELTVDAPADFSLLGDLPPSNPSIDEGLDRSVEAHLHWNLSPLRTWSARARYRVAGGALAGDFDYTRGEFHLLRRNIVGRWQLRTEAGYVRTTGDAPVQRLADAGGSSTVRGYPRRSLVGSEALTLRAELPVPYDLLRRSGVVGLRDLGVQFVPWADAARVDGRGDDAAWIHAVGLGLQKHVLGFGRAARLRLDVAVPVGPRRPADVVFLLRFVGR